MKIYYEHFRVMVWQKPSANKRKGRPYLSMLERFRRGRTKWLPYERGGHTVCTIRDDEDNKILGVGAATCSMSDNFNYKIGRDIARGRAEKKLE